VAPTNHILDEVRIPMGSATFERRVPTHYNVPTAGECACPAHAADEYMEKRRCGLLLNYFAQLLYVVR